MIVSFSGVDCSGKSTQIALLRKHLEESGKKVRVLWYRPGYSEELEKVKGVLFKKRGTSAGSRGATAKPSSASRIKDALWLTSALMDSLFQWSVKLRWLNRRYDVVILDRHVDDGILDLENRCPGLLNYRLFYRYAEKLFAAVRPRFLLLLPHDVMLERMDIKQEPFPDPAALRDKRYDAYMALKDDARYTVIDAGQSIEAVFSDILSHWEGAS